jgi:hypothetical protein
MPSAINLPEDKLADLNVSPLFLTVISPNLREEHPTRKKKPASMMPVLYPIIG